MQSYIQKYIPKFFVYVSIIDTSLHYFLSHLVGQILDVQPGDLDSDMDLDLLVSSAYLVFWYENTGSTDGGLFNETHVRLMDIKRFVLTAYA